MAVKRQRPLYEQVYDLLWDKLLNGEIASAGRIRDADWAKTLNVSRTPVREAFRKIEHEGVIETRENGRYTVRQFEPSDLRALYRCRAALEGIAASDAAEQITDRDLTKLKSLIHSAKVAAEKRDSAGAAKANTEFHEIIWRASKNLHVMRLLTSLQRIIVFCRRGVLNQTESDKDSKARYAKHLKAVLEDHRLILAALTSKNASMAETRMRDHLQQTSVDMAKLVSYVAASSRAGNGSRRRSKK